MDEMNKILQRMNVKCISRESLKIEVDIETLEDVLITARKSAYGSEWDSIHVLSDLIDKAKESRRPSNLDNLFRGPGYFSGETVDENAR